MFLNLYHQTKILATPLVCAIVIIQNLFQCRWLILPNNCELNLVCSLGTRKQEGRVGDLDLLSATQNQKCSNFDFLRVMGYKGAMDAVYCGNEKLSLKVGPHNTLVNFYVFLMLSLSRTMY